MRPALLLSDISSKHAHGYIGTVDPYLVLASLAITLIVIVPIFIICRQRAGLISRTANTDSSVDAATSLPEPNLLSKTLESAISGASHLSSTYRYLQAVDV
jgi:hypothetical protein